MPKQKPNEQVQQIPLSEIRPFKNHPFKVTDDELMQQTIDSIMQVGVLNPAIIRPAPEGGYEMVAGHRRLHAADLAGLKTIPAIVRNLDDDEAVILMVDSNLQRETISPMERAQAYKMKLEALKHQGKRRDLTSSQVGTKLRTDEIIAQQTGSSRNQVQRFVRLNELVPEIQKKVDSKEIAFSPAVELSYLTHDEQKQFLDAMDYSQNTPSLSQAQRLKKLSREGKCTKEAMRSIMSEEKKEEQERIVLREGMSEVQTVCAAVHEIAHSKLHNKDEIGEKYQAVELFGKPALFSNWRIDRDKLPEGLYVYDLRGSDYDPGMPVTLESHVTVNHAASVITAAPIELPEQGFLYLGEDGLNFTGGEQTVKEFWHAQYPEKAKLSRAAEEIQAESISFAVCAYYGIETGENSFGYLATWAKDRELTELRASLETINRTSSSLITDIDRHYAEICKERGLDKETESLAAQPVQEIAVQEPEPVTAPDNGCVPDPAISVESMNAYGYTDSNMLPLTKERALELMERDVSVYMLHTDNTEAMAFDAEEVRSFDGVFGVEASEWETVKDRFAPPDYEKAFLDNTADSFAIYQLRDNDNTAQLRFMNAEYLEKKGLSIEKGNYASVYAGGLDRRGDTQDRLDELYETFNLRRPEDFRGHSLSVSDIVALKQNGVVSCHYVDSQGFKELPDFLKPENYLKNAEMAMEDDYGMIDGVINNGPKQTVAELEEQAKSGKPISLLEPAQAARREQAQAARQDKKPSVPAKLCPPVNEPKKTARSKRAERELL